MTAEQRAAVKRAIDAAARRAIAKRKARNAEFAQERKADRADQDPNRAH